MRPPLRHAPVALRTARVIPQFPAGAPWLQPPSQRLSTTTSTRHTSSSTSHSPASASVNETEISHFSALASSWWDPHGPSRPLHLMNPLRHDFIQSCLASSPSSATHNNTTDGLRYLDVGCGGGIFAESAARLPSTASVTAIDPSPIILAVARAHAKRDPALAATRGGQEGKKKLTYLSETIESLPLPPDLADRFDVVSVFEVVEHVDYPAAFLDRVGEFVRPGGWLVLSTIARTWTSWLTTNLVAEDLLGVVPKGTHDWYKYINEDELRAYFAAKDGGRWGVPRVMGVVYVPGLGWKEVKGSEKVGNYFLGVQRIS
ncbi:hypothetical protein VTI28DRAFT_7480 [Corynascus sepedonium]